MSFLLNLRRLQENRVLLKLIFSHQSCRCFWKRLISFFLLCKNDLKNACLIWGLVDFYISEKNLSGVFKKKRQNQSINHTNDIIYFYMSYTYRVLHDAYSILGGIQGKKKRRCSSQNKIISKKFYFKTDCLKFWCPKSDMGNPNWVEGRIQDDFSFLIKIFKKNQFLRLLKKDLVHLYFGGKKLLCQEVYSIKKRQ
jgi:hypothetical protein